MGFITIRHFFLSTLQFAWARNEQSKAGGELHN